MSDTTERRHRLYAEVRSTADRLEHAHENIGRALSDAEEAAAALDGSTRPRRRRRQGLEREVEAFVSDGRTHNLAEIAVGLDHPQPAVSAALLMLMQEGKVDRVARGQYRQATVARTSSKVERAIEALARELQAAKTRIAVAESSVSVARADASRIREALLQLKGPRRLQPVSRFASSQAVAARRRPRAAGAAGGLGAPAARTVAGRRSGDRQ